MTPEFSPSCLKKITAIIKKALTNNDMRAEKEDPQTIRFVPAQIVAKIVRAMLKDLYPDTKFCVRTHKYAGGSSVNIFYLEGQADSKYLYSVLSWFCCKGFDGMTDSTYYTAPIQLAGYTLSPTSHISENAVEPGGWAAREYKLSG